LERIKAVEREYRVARLAMAVLGEALRVNPSLLKENELSHADAQKVAVNTEMTYLIRLFAVFEAGLRDGWENCYNRKTTTKTKDLLDGIASKARIKHDIVEKAHAVRMYRNALVHEGDERAKPIPLERARQYLCTFFSWLPQDW
jgi:hypothetical protein